MEFLCLKNHGRGAGTSFEHTHSQIVGSGIVPSHVRRKLEEAARYYDDHGRCVYGDLVEEELNAGKRIVLKNKKFVVLQPFASWGPFETWIIPKDHQASFGFISMKDSKLFGKVLNTTLFKLYSKLNDPDYNYVIHTAPIKDEGGLLPWVP